MDGARDIIDVLRLRAARSPQDVALRARSGELTYAQLEQASNRIARALSAQGLAPGARVAVLAKNSPAQLEIWWGAMKAGVVLVPVNYRLAPREIAFILQDAGAALLFVGRGYEATAAQLQQDVPGLRTVVTIEGGHAGWPSLAGFCGPHDAAPVDRQPAPGEVAVQVYTSGTTGRPKGVLTTHANLMAEVRRNEAKGLWQEGDVVLLCLPVCHIGGIGIVLRGIRFGMRLVLLEEFDAGEVLRSIAAERITKAFLVPSMLHFLLEHPACREADLSSLDLVFYGAGPMPYELLTRAMQVFRCRFGASYGMTETTGGCTYLTPDDHAGPDAAQRIRSSGRASASRLRIVDEAGRDVPTGSVGEIMVATPQLCAGYFRLPEDTAGAIVDGWLHTGDAGFLDADGYLTISDRIKDMVVSGGLKIYPREVEEVMLQHPAVAEVAVIGVPDARWSEALKAIVVRRAGMAASTGELLAFVRERLAGFKVPKTVDFVPSLPRNAAGKVLKRELRQPFWEGRDRLV